MATRTIGKLKYNASRRGIAWKWGDGEIHRIPFQSSRNKEEDENEEQYGSASEYRSDDGSSYYEEYGSGNYDSYDEEPEENEEYPSGIMGYILTHDWVMWLSLLVLAPLGIYILWKRKEFDIPVRVGISVASLILFIILIILLFSGRGRSDNVTKTGNIKPPVTQVPAITVRATIPAAATTAPTLSPEEIPDVTLAPTATPRPDDSLANPGSTAAPTANDPIVYFNSNGQYYHSSSDNDHVSGATAATKSYAMSLGKTACPICYGENGEGVSAIQGTVYYMTTNGTYFHKNATCSGMKNAFETSQASAEQAGKIPCPTCVGYYATTGGKYYHVDKNCSGMKNAGLYTLATCKNRGQTACPVCLGNTSDTTLYYHTTGGKYYHTDKNCSGMKNATQVTLAVAVAAGQSPCPTCVGANTATAYYATTNGKFYHTDKTCSGMKNAKQVTKAAAEASGKTACPTCIGIATKGSTQVFFTAGGTYYHTNSTCSGMKNAQAGTIETAKKAGKKACPTCIGSSGTYVYCTSGGTYYHIDSKCSGMKNPSYVSIETAKAAGKGACPVCIGKSSASSAPAASTASGSKVYYTAGGTYYHMTSNCSGMKNATTGTLSAAVASGKKACPVCIGADNTKVYATNAGIYYHSKSNCSGMTGAKTTTVTIAKTNGKVACPVCIGSSDTKVYLTQNGTYYHANATCSGMAGASFLSLSTARSLGKTACPVCLGSGTALHDNAAKAASQTNTSSVSTGGDFTVYCTAAGTYYHTDRTCSGMTGAKAATLSSVIRGGKYPCPTCVDASDRNMVYATPGGRYYHTNKTCSGMTNASTITIKVAVANGKTPCPTCAGGTITSKTQKTSAGSSSSKTDKVYCTENGKYYHKTSNCSGMTKAFATTKEQAVYTYGKTACPVCIGTGTSSASTGNTASASTNSVYATLTKVFCTKNGKYYHFKSNCSGMQGAAATTMAAASASGKKACPVCINTTSSTKVYASVDNPYYHTKSVCNGVTLTIATNYTNAVAAGKTGCPYCTGKTNANTSTSTNRVYATLAGDYYHYKSNCTLEDLSGASYISLTKAQNYNKAPCPACVTAAAS